MNPNANKRQIVFYDNQCMLCHWSVRFIVRYDKKEHFFFAPLQGVVWQQLGAARATKVIPESVQYFDGNTISCKSDAVLNILRQLGGVWKFFTIFRLIPGTWRNAAYDFIARNRHQWLDEPAECSLENQLPAGRILD